MSVLTDNTAKLRKILEKVENLPEIPGSVAQATPSITVSSGGLITASATQEAGVVASGTKSATRQLTTKGGTTITPGTSEQTAVSAGTYVTGDIKVAAAAGGKQVATGTVSITGMSQKTMTLNVGFTPSTIYATDKQRESIYPGGSKHVHHGVYYDGSSMYTQDYDLTMNTENGTVTLTSTSGFSRRTWSWIAAE